MKKISKTSRMRLFFSLTAFILIMVTVSACIGQSEPDVQDQVATYAAQTLQAFQAEQTLSAYEAQATQMAIANPTATAVPPTATAQPTEEPPQVNCNMAEFIKDLSLADGASVSSGEAITKGWRLKNVGSCTWTTDYDLVFVEGKSMGAATRIGLTETVKPGETIDLYVLMEAPTTVGTYQGFWMLEDANGNRFGIGDDGDGAFWVKINVTPTVVYNFVDKYCDADWYSSQKNPLPCPGTENDNQTGFVYRVNTPTRENGTYENEAAIFTSPDNDSDDGKIVGVYPAFEVKDGDVFKAVIGCMNGFDKCDLRFELLYRIGTGPVKSLAHWYEVYEGKMNSVSVDLSSLAGEDVTFILMVRNHTTAAENVGMWIQPRIIR